MYGDVKISVACLHKLYKKHNIRFKAIYKRKVVRTSCVKKYEEMKQNLKRTVSKLLDAHLDILFLDECMFTYSTQQSKTYSRPK